MLLCWWDSLRSVLAVARRKARGFAITLLSFTGFFFHGSRSKEYLHGVQGALYKVYSGYAHTEMTALHVDPWPLAEELLRFVSGKTAEVLTLFLSQGSLTNRAEIVNYSCDA